MISASLGAFYLRTSSPYPKGLIPRNDTSIAQGETQTAPSPGLAAARQIRNPEVIGDAVLLKDVGSEPAWAVGYGAEFWHVQKTPGAAPVKGTPLPCNVNVGDIIERVSHAVLPEEGSLIGKDRDYTATFGGAGFRIAPRDSEGGAVSEAAFRTVSMTSGSDELFLGEQLAGAWLVLGNTVQRQLNQAQGIVEHYQLTSEGVEVT